MATMENIVHRYTILASALDALRNRRLALVNPGTWPDQNDTALIKRYQVARKLKGVFALCLTQAAETAHHWSAFAPGTDGVRIELYRDRLEEAVSACPGVVCRNVVYQEIRSFGSGDITADDLPFIKRYPYRGEEEVRLLYASATDDLDFYPVPLPIECVKRITLGATLPSPLVDAVAETIRNIPGCEALPVHRTTLLRNQRWINSANGVN